MGNKFSAVNGVRSDNFTQPGNAVNEIWVGNTEIISRLPFGDNDMEQAGWPLGGIPKIPWHNFIIPLKRDVNNITDNTPFIDFSPINNIPPNQIVWCNQCGCSSPQKADTTIHLRFSNIGVNALAVGSAIIIYLWLAIPWITMKASLRNNPSRVCDRLDAQVFLPFIGIGTLCYAFGAWAAVTYWREVQSLFEDMSQEWQLLAFLARYFLLYRTVAGAWDLVNCWKEWWKAYRNAVPIQADRLIVSYEGKLPSSESEVNANTV